MFQRLMPFCMIFKRVAKIIYTIKFLYNMNTCATINMNTSSSITNNVIQGTGEVLASVSVE